MILKSLLSVARNFFLGCLILFLFQSFAIAQTAERSLELNKRLEGEIKGSETHTYTVTLSAKQYLKVTVTQVSVNVQETLIAPDGSTVSASDDMTAGAENIFYISQTAGTYRLQVKPVRENFAGKYAIELTALRDATTQDENQIAAKKAIMDAQPLFLKNTPEDTKLAIAKFEEALRLSRAASDRLLEGVALNNLGTVYERQNDRKKALEFYTEALKIRSEIGDKSGEASVLYNLGMIYDYLGERQKALDVYMRSLGIRRELGDKKGEAASLNNIGRTYSTIGENQKALDYLQQSLPIRREVGDKRGEAATVLNIGTIYDSLGNTQLAIENFNQSLALFRETKEKNGEAMALNWLGVVYHFMGEEQQALDYFNMALELRRALQNQRGVAITLGSIALCYISLGEPQRALELYGEALPILRNVGDINNEAILLNNSALAKSELKEYEQAADLFKQSLTLLQKLNDKTLMASVLTSSGSIQQKLGNNQRALEFFTQALALAIETGNRRAEAATLNNMASINHALGDKQKAVELNTQALAIHRQLNFRIGEAKTLNGLAIIAREEGRLEEAQRSSEQALEIIESLRSNLEIQELRTSFLSNVYEYYDSYIEILMERHKASPQQGFAALAFQASERARARTLLDTLKNSRVDIRQGVDVALLEKERNLQQQISVKSTRLTRLLASNKNAEQISKEQSELEVLKTSYQEIVKQIRVTSPNYSALTHPQPLSFSDIQKRVIDNDSVLLEYALGDKQSYLWAVTKDSVQAFTLPPRAEIEKAVRNLYDLMTARNKQVKFETVEEKNIRVAEADKEIAKATNGLSEMILAPAAKALTKKRLLVVADGALQYVPFAALEMTASQQQAAKNKTGKQPLIGLYEIVNLPSASTLAVLRDETKDRKPAPKTVAVFADPVFDADDERFKTIAKTNANKSNELFAKARSRAVSASSDLTRAIRDINGSDSDLNLSRLPFTRKEADAISSLVPSVQRKATLDFSANRDAATNPELSQYRIVHFATHSFINNTHPELSGIVLSLVDEEGKTKDGFLRTSDVFNMKLPADLVVLSGCRTGLGKETRGEGFIGLTRGFMYAGASRIAVSLWDVNDEATSELMTRFYRGMFVEKLSPAAALKQAQVSMSKDKRWNSPYYWASFVLQGEPK